MKKLLTILTMLMAVVTQGYAAETTLWEDTYSDGVELNSETVATFKAGDVLRVYATVPESGANFKICYKGESNSWAETAIPSLDNQWPWVNGGDTYYEIAFTEADITALSGMNIYIYQGESSNISKVSLITEDSSPTYEGTVIYNDGDVVMGTEWSQYIQLSADKFADLNPGAVIRVYIKDVLDDVQAVFQDGSWQDITGVDAVYPAATDAYYELTLTSSVLSVVKESGLIVKGKNFTACAVTITSTGMATTQYTLTVTQPETGGTIKIGDNTAETAQYDEGTAVTLTAEAAESYEFVKWTKDGVDAGTETTLEVTMTADVTIAAVFSEIVVPAFSLDGFTADDGNSYDASTHILTVANAWSGGQLWIGEHSTYSGSKLVIKTSEDCKLKVLVGYVGGGEVDMMDSEAAKKHALDIDNTKKIEKVIIQNQEATAVTFESMELDPEPDPEPVVTPVFTDGKADLGKLESQNAEKVTVSVADGKATVTTTEGWTGVQLTVPDGESVSGKEIKITMQEAKALKVSVKKSSEDAGTDFNLDAAATQYIEFDETTNIYQIQIQPTEAATLVISEIAVNAESTKPAEPVVTPVFTDGKADLGKLESQNAEKVTVSVADGKATVTTTEGWTGVQLTVPDGESVSGKEIKITMQEAKALKVSVKKSSEDAGTDFNLDAAATQYIEFDETTNIYQIQIQPTEAATLVISEIAVNAESTKPAEPVVTPVFTDGKADLGKLESQNAEKVTVSVADGKATVTTTEGWTGVQLTVPDGESVSGKEIKITMQEAKALKVSVKKSSEDAGTDFNLDAAATQYIEFDETTNIYQIQIQPTEAATLVISEITVNAESTKPADPEPTPDPGSEGVNISLDDLNEGWSSSYDAATSTITTEGEWAARGWKIGDGRYNGKGSITVKFEAVEFGVTLKMEYTNADDVSKTTETGAPAGETEVTLDIPSDMKTMDKVYITFQPVASLKLIAATVNDPVVDNRTEKTLVEKTQAIADGDVEINRGLFGNAAVGDELRIYATGLSESAKLALEPSDYSGALDGANWTGFTESPFKLKLTASLLAKIKAQNLLVRGENYTFTKSVLYTENELGEAVDDGGSEPEPEPEPEPANYQIVNTNATAEAKKVFDVLKSLYGNKIISGTVANVDWNYDEAKKVYGWTDKWPAMNVFDFTNIHASKDVNSDGWLDYSDDTPVREWWNAGGLVGAMWHWQVAANNGTDLTCTPGTGDKETAFDASKVYVDGSSENMLAKRQLDQVCGYLKKMQDAGIPVIWRPFHEAAGNTPTGGDAWFWWGAMGADVYKKLWQWTYNYMVTIKGLNNLIWVWTSQTNDEAWYPGDEYVDIIGRDSYGAGKEQLKDEYDLLSGTYPQKMITLSECGNTANASMAPVSDFWNADARWSWFMTWYNASGETVHNAKTWWTDAFLRDYVVDRDQMKELLDIAPSKLVLEERRTLWTGNEDFTPENQQWGTKAEQSAAVGAILEEGEKIFLTVSAIAKDAEDIQIVLRSADYEHTLGFNMFSDITSYPADVKLILSASDVAAFSDGFHITGKNCTVTKMVLYKPTSVERTERTLKEEKTAVGDGIEINRGLFSNAAEEDVLKVYFEVADGATAKINLEDMDYNGIESSWPVITTSPYTYTFTAAALEKIKSSGMRIRGENFTFLKATLLTESELGTAISGTDDNGDNGSGDNGGGDNGQSSSQQENPVFDEKNGEADLSKMAPQDEKTTTVTYDKNTGSFTMTTTEAYKAAQIWFNTPQNVTGNVLEVEIEQANIDVTVTVGYVGGNESAMSSKAAGTRASAGTTIYVPLEIGKQIQKIEVKNAKAGTITVNSMTMTNMNVFCNYKANLSMLKPQSGATYDVSTYTLATTRGWTGATVSPLDDETVKGAELVIRFDGEAKVKLAVKYRTDEDGPSLIMEESNAIVKLALNKSKAIQEIMIQPTEAAILTFKEIVVYPEAGMANLLHEGKTVEVWRNDSGEQLAWNEIARQGKDICSELMAYDEILVTVSGKAEGNDWPKVFLRDKNSEQIGREKLLNEVAAFPHVARFVLTEPMVERLNSGFCICGDGVTVTKVEIYRPYPPKKGDIHLRALDYGYDSEYDAATQTVTTTSRWAARGWEIGDSRYNSKDLIVVGFEEVDFPVTLKMEYTDASGEHQATSAGVAGGHTEVRLAIPVGIKKMDKVYVIYQNPGSLTLTDASVLDASQASTRGITEDSRGISIAGRDGYGLPHDGYDGDDAWYTLSGRRIEKPVSKGVYIHQGRKVIVE